MMEITAEIRALIDKAAAGMELAGDEYIDPSDGLIHCKKCGAASKFLYIDKGEKAAIRALANGKYLSQKDNIITASTSDIADNEYFLFKNEGDPTTINELRNNEIDCSVVSNQIIIKNAIGEQVNIFDLSGKLLYRQNISTNNENIYFNNGNYLIQIGDKTFKCNI